MVWRKPGTYPGMYAQRGFEKSGYKIATKRTGISPAKAVEEDTDIKVLKAGGVKVGKITYHGSSIVPGSSGRTANQIRMEMFKEAQKKGIVKRGTFTASIPASYYADKPLDQPLASKTQEVIAAQKRLTPAEKSVMEKQEVPTMKTKRFLGLDWQMGRKPQEEKEEEIKLTKEQKKQRTKERKELARIRYEKIQAEGLTKEDWIARTKSGKVSIFGTMGKSFGAMIDIGVAKTGLYKTKIGEISPVAKVGARTEVLSSLATFTAFSPFMASTTAIEKSLIKPITKVDFLGTTQKTKKGLIKTEIGFKAKTGKKVRFGKAEGITQVTKTKTPDLKYKDIIIKKGKPRFETETFATGKVGTKALEIPTGKMKLIKTKQFFGVEKGRGLKIGDRIGVHVSKGHIATGKKIKIKVDVEKEIIKIRGGKPVKFKGRGLQFIGKEQKFSLSLGEATSKKGLTLSRGLIKHLPKKTTDVGGEIIIQTGGKGITFPSTTAISKQAALLSVKSIVKAQAVEGVSKVVIPSTKGFISGLTPSLKIKPKAETITRTKIKPVIMPRVRITPHERIGEVTITKVKTRTKQKPAIIPTTTPVVIPDVIPKEKEKIKPIVTPRIILQKPLEPSPPRPIIPFIPPIDPTKTPKIILPRFKFGGAFTFGKVGKVGGIQKTKYTPSFKAVLFKLRTRKPTPPPETKFTGFEVRPFTKGFAFFRKRKKRKR